MTMLAEHIDGVLGVDTHRDAPATAAVSPIGAVLETTDAPALVGPARRRAQIPGGSGCRGVLGRRVSRIRLVIAASCRLIRGMPVMSGTPDTHESRPEAERAVMRTSTPDHEPGRARFRVRSAHAVRAGAERAGP
ncbi:hypothetical protein [Streptomyces sp. HUAS TT20]|uniref:hypothetical protein n=1 Tax=Streptomyces sp. HUAS TT20 TaxID=3447509 RepID=UPI0021D8925E|nr:hypothetical protein [Streptomyces sp. HUAS 15-9]UXY32290.1 hypothetical protein N8I87_41170 [Streptomyces sp. HUAS 15-9]